MNDNTEVAVRVGVPAIDIAAAVEAWLQFQVEYEETLLRRGRPVRTSVELADRVGALALAEFGALEKTEGYPWAQCMRVDGA